jgi:NADPH2:quinone reductase
MKAILVARRGGPEVLELREVPDPQPRSERDEIIVDVEAVGVNFADTLQTQGTYLQGPRPPYIPGMEFAGKISGTSQRVMGFTNVGAYAQKVAVNKSSLLPVPASWTSAQAAAFPVNYFTAYFAYWMAGMLTTSPQPSAAKGHSQQKRVLIHAVAGGVGTAAVEVGSVLGVEMYGTSSSEEKLAKVKRLGLQHGINYKDKDYEKVIADLTSGHGVDAVFEMLGGEHTARSTRCLAPMGRMIIYGMATGQAPHFDFMSMFQKNLSTYALWLAPLASDQQLMADAWKQLSSWVEAGKLRPEVGTELPLNKASEAHRLLLERKNYGKVVLTI